jgi:hypothetical protein
MHRLKFIFIEQGNILSCVVYSCALFYIFSPPPNEVHWRGGGVNILPWSKWLCLRSQDGLNSFSVLIKQGISKSDARFWRRKIWNGWLVGCCAVKICRYWPTFHRYFLPSSSGRSSLWDVWNVSPYVPGYTAQRPWRQPSSIGFQARGYALERTPQSTAKWSVPLAFQTLTILTWNMYEMGKWKMLVKFLSQVLQTKFWQ